MSHLICAVQLCTECSCVCHACWGYGCGMPKLHASQLRAQFKYDAGHMKDHIEIRLCLI